MAGISFIGFVDLFPDAIMMRHSDSNPAADHDRLLRIKESLANGISATIFELMSGS
jgi:hypothetical protein